MKRYTEIKKEATFKKVKDAPPMGKYKPTSVDKSKKDVDFKLISIDGKYYTIDWKNGERETVSKREFEKLSKQYNYITDF